VAREQWTQFSDLPMLLGLTLFAASLVLHAAAAFSSSDIPLPASAGGAHASHGWLAAAARRVQAWQLVGRLGCWRLPVPSFRAWLAAAALVHGVGIFSFFYLLTEGALGGVGGRQNGL